jgi:hypothetical protein
VVQVERPKVVTRLQEVVLNARGVGERAQDLLPVVDRNEECLLWSRSRCRRQRESAIRPLKIAKAESSVRPKELYAAGAGEYMISLRGGRQLPVGPNYIESVHKTLLKASVPRFG